MSGSEYAGKGLRNVKGKRCARAAAGNSEAVEDIAVHAAIEVGPCYKAVRGRTMGIEQVIGVGQEGDCVGL